MRKPFWPELGVTKGHLLVYYAEVSPVLLPDLHDRAMVMKRYPNGAAGDFFFMKRAPSPRSDWISICSIEHASGNVIGFPIVQDLASLLWVVNLGCIDLNQWYARLRRRRSPGLPAFRSISCARRNVRQSARSGAARSRSIRRTRHAVVPQDQWIERHPRLRAYCAWPGAEAGVGLCQGPGDDAGGEPPRLLTAEYRIAKRPAVRVLVDYNQNAWGRTLASVYSVRPNARPTVSTPVTWSEVERGVEIEDYDIYTVPARVRRRGDIWAPLLENRGRFNLGRYL